MKQVRKMNLPIAGQVQHGIQQNSNNKKKVIELGYFIAKVKDNNLQFLLNRFEEKLKQRTAITVRFFDEDPLTIRQVRYNQSGTVCYCMEGQTEAKQKVQNKWTNIECKKDCQYRIKPKQGRAMCNEEGTLRFMLPDICTDKIWYMKITGYTSIQTLQDYINFQKQLGNSLIGDYVIFLKEVEQTNSEGKKFKNKILDIIKKEDFISNNQKELSNQIFPQNQTQLSTNQVKNVDNLTEIQKDIVSKTNTIENSKVEKTEQIVVEDNIQNIEKTENKTIKKTAKTKKEDTKQNKAEENNSSMYDKCHMLIDTETKTLMKDGKPTEYLFANFVDTKDQMLQVIIPPQLAEELKKYGLGTAVILDLQTKGDKTFTNKIEYVEKCIKEVAA